MRDADPDQEPGRVTRLLLRAREGDDEAIDEFFPLVYDTLSRISRAQLRDRASPTLDTVGLVHEAYLKLLPGTGVEWEDRAHFFSVAARAMRQVLIDRARRRATAKHGGDRRRIPLEARHLRFREPLDDLLALEEALNRLEARSERLARVVEFRFFAGMSTAEVAEVVGVSTRTVERDWTKARLFLHRELNPDGDAGVGADERPRGPS